MKTVYFVAGVAFVIGGAGLLMHAVDRNRSSAKGSETKKEVYAVYRGNKGGGWPSDQANVVASAYGGVVATDIQLELAATTGMAKWGSPAWVAVATFGTPVYAAVIPGSAQANVGEAGVTVYGIKPKNPMIGQTMS